MHNIQNFSPQPCMLPKRDKTRCASFISLSRRSPHTNTSHSAAAHCSRKKNTLENKVSKGALMMRHRQLSE